jgi:hypothetical protein
MKFYSGKQIDKQGRFSLWPYFEPKTKVVVWVEDSDYTLIHIKAYLELDKDIPECGIRSTDEKCRIIIPRGLRGNATRALIAKDPQAGIVLKLFYDDVRFESEEDSEAEEAS